MLAIPWNNPILMIMVWLTIVTVTLWVLNLLFPRMHRSSDDQTKYDI